MALPLLAAGTLAGFIMSLVGPIINRILIALGIGVISMIGYEYLEEQLKTAVENHMADMVGDIYQILALAGFVDAVGIYFGVMTTVGALRITSSLGRWAMKN